MASDALWRLRRICSRHIYERDAHWQYGLDGGIQTRLFLDLMEAAHVDESLHELADLMTSFIADRMATPERFVVAGPKRGNALLIRETARRLGQLSAFVKEQPLFGRWIEGPIDPASPVVVIDDIASDGELLVSVIEHLRDEGHQIIGAVVLVDRQEGDSGQLLRQHNVAFHFLMAASDEDLRRLRAEAARGMFAQGD